MLMDKFLLGITVGIDVFMYDWQKSKPKQYRIAMALLETTLMIASVIAGLLLAVQVKIALTGSL